MTPTQPPAVMASFVLLLFRSFLGLIWTRCSKKQTLIKRSFFSVSIKFCEWGGEGRGGPSLYTRSGQKMNTLIYCHLATLESICLQQIIDVLVKNNHVL